MMDARQQLYDAALTGETQSLLILLKADKLILDRCMSDGRYTKSPLHVAVNAGHLEFTYELLCRKPELAEEVDQVKMWSPLHMASAKGHLRIIRALVDAKPRMCFAYDRDGMTPIHVAVVNGRTEALQIFLESQPLAVREPTARGETVLHLCVKTNQPNVLKSLLAAAVGITDASMCLVRDQNGRTPIHVAATNGHIEVLELLHRVNPYAAQERTNNGDTILHLCIKHAQLEALKTLIQLFDDDGDQLINSKDNDGNTILYLAVTCNQVEMVSYLVEDCRSSIEINAVNKKNMTVVDLYNKQKKKSLGDILIGLCLRDGKAKEAMELAERFENERSALMVVASLLATMAFQVVTNPPGGVYQDTIKGEHEAGTAIWSYGMKGFHGLVVSISTLAFLTSITVILILIRGVSYTRGTISHVRAILMIATISTWGIFCVVSVRLIHGRHREVRDYNVTFLRFFFVYVLFAIYLLLVTFSKTVGRYCKNGFNWLQVVLSLNRGEEGRPPNADA